tara:strand:- start:103 stop:1383 length:1281 start_codon:yes stop_codon:yes gene_type:complete
MTAQAVDLAPSEPEDDDPPPPVAPPPALTTTTKTTAAKRKAGPSKSRRRTTKLPPDWVYPGAKPPLTGFVEAMPADRTWVQQLTAKMLVPNYAEPKGLPVPDDKYLVVDLFCSIGGVSQAAADLGHRVVLAVDFDQQRLDVHALNHPDAVHWCLELGPDTEEELVAKIQELVPADQWHRLWLHLSPPCQTQSAGRSMGMANESRWQIEEDKRDGLMLVAWSLALVARLDPPQFSIEEVDDTGGKVQGVMRKYRSRDQRRYDFEVFHMEDYGVPQTRHRVICARPGTIHALRHEQTLRVSPPVCAHEVLDLPEHAGFYRGFKTRSIKDPEKVKPCPTLQGRWSDGKVELYDLSIPTPTVCSRGFDWIRPDFSYLRAFLWQETAAVMTFPMSFQWPGNMSNSGRNAALGNAVPPLFARKVIRAGSLNL